MAFQWLTVDEDQSLGLELRLGLEPRLAGGLHVGALLFGRMAGLLWNGPPLPAARLTSRPHAMKKERAMTIAILGVDLGENICSVVGLDITGAVVLRRRMRRQTLIGLAAELPACVVAMEACCGAHHLGRIFVGQGHEVRLMSPEYVRPYVKAQKNDDRDAEAVAEAASRPTMRFVELKTEDQLDMQSLHRVRQRLVGARRTLLNQLRAILFERGHAIAQGRRKLELAVDGMLADASFPLSRRIRVLVEEIRAEWRQLDQRIDALNAEFAEQARTDDAARRLLTIPGVRAERDGADGRRRRRQLFPPRTRSRRLARPRAPRQHTTGGKPKLLGITKRGNQYLRMLFMHGARAALPSLAKSASPLGGWLRGLLARGHRNIAVVALANKLARIAWAILRGDESFDLRHGAMTA